MTMSDPLEIPTETVTDCARCDAPNTITIWDHLRSGDWHYEFVCDDCDYENRATGTNLERGAITPAASFWMFAAVVTALLVLMWQPVLFWTITALAAYTVACLLIIAVFAGAERAHKKEEADHE
jgi:hypothetical protein